MAHRIDIEKVIDAVVTTLQAGIAAQVTTINAETSDFDIAAPPTTNYHKALKRIIPQYPAVCVYPAETAITYHADSARFAEYLIKVAFLHTGPDGTEESNLKYCMRMARAFDQILLATPALTMTPDIIEYTFTESIEYNAYEEQEDSPVIQSAVLTLRILEATEDF